MGKGGVRYGAGRPGYTVKAEHVCRIDVREWARRGYLRGACAFSWSWHCDGEPAGSIGVRVFGPDALTLEYTATVGGVSRQVAEKLTLHNTPCGYGGRRQWFKCPCCARRMAMLYMRSGRFACRHCQRVSYRSQSGSAIDRVCARFHKLDALVMAGKPKWQRWATFDRLCDRHEAASEHFEAAIGRQLARMGCTW